MKKIIILGMLIVSIQYSFSMSPDKSEESEGKKIEKPKSFIEFVESIKNTPEENQVPSLTPKSRRRNFPGFTLLKAHKPNDGFLDLCTLVARAGLALEDALPGLTVVNISSGLYVKIGLEKQKNLLNKMEDLQATILTLNNVPSLSDSYIQVQKNCLIEQHARRSSGEMNEQMRQQIASIGNDKNNLEEQVVTLKAQLQGQSRLFTKKTISAGITGAIVASCAFAAYLKWWHAKPSA
jgi:hypothetical protein